MIVQNPGNIKQQVGMSLNAIRQAVEARDVDGVADHLSLLLAIASPKLDEKELERLRVPAVPGGRDRSGEKARKLFRDCMGILAELLRLLSDRGLYSWVEPPVGDGSGLALTDEGGEA